MPHGHEDEWILGKIALQFPNTATARCNWLIDFLPFFGQNEYLPDDVEGCDIAHPFRDFMAESLRETNEKVKLEMEKTMKSLQGRAKYAFD